MASMKSHTGNHSKNLAFTHCRGEEKDTRSSTSILEGQVPNILSNGTNLIRTQSDVNSRLGRTIQTRPLRNTRFSNLRFNSLPFHGTRLFNRLPKDVRNITGLPKMTFKRSLDSLLSHINDEPQLLQYSNSNQVQSNSLLHHKFPVTQSMREKHSDRKPMSLNAIKTSPHLGRASARPSLIRFLHSWRSFMAVFSSSVLSSPVSCFNTSVYRTACRPLFLLPLVGSHSTRLWASSSSCLTRCPDSLSLLSLIVCVTGGSFW